MEVDLVLHGTFLNILFLDKRKNIVIRSPIKLAAILAANIEIFLLRFNLRCSLSKKKSNHSQKFDRNYLLIAFKTVISTS